MEILTEQQNSNTENIDILSPLEIVSLINQEDLQVAQVVKKALKDVSLGVEFVEDSFLKGGRLLYFGAGTSGRLGVLDASECPPTFNSKPEMVQGFIAGGDTALRFAVEGAEDSFEAGKQAAGDAKVNKNDTVVALSASGNPNYIMGVLEKSRILGAKTIVVTCNEKAQSKKYADCFIALPVGPEVITGSTRLKAGTAQKMVLNMLTTASMIRIGKVYKNFMIDVKPTNKKLKKRAVGIVSQIAEIPEAKAKSVLEDNDYKIKHTILMIKFKLNFEQANDALNKNNGILRKAMATLS